MTGTTTEYGDREIALGNEILRSVVGSGVHGIAIEGTDDHDEMGVFVGPPEQLLGLQPPMEHYVFRTQPEGHTSDPGDVDLVVYSLRKYLKLAVQGNPTALLPLYAPADSLVVVTSPGEELRALAPRLLSRQAVLRFLGYMDAQRRRLLPSDDGSAAKGRPELVERFGYDVKYASHALRLAYQGREVARDAHLTLPMAPAERERVLSVKRGEVASVEDVLDELRQVQREVEQLITSGSSPLPERPDTQAVSAWSVVAHRRHWGW